VDELLEVTPKNLRLRKRILDTDERRKITRREGKEEAAEA
jgi:predicted membrane GTPase involved in stress response